VKRRHVIIGTSAAGIGAVSRLASLVPNDEIICVSASRYPPYNTCLLADVLSGSRTCGSIATRPLSFFEENGIDLRLDTAVLKIDTAEKKLTLSREETLRFDTLFLGMGTTSKRLQIIGGDYVGVFFFADCADLKELSSFIKERSVKQAVVIGAGLSGVECADALTARGISAAIVESSLRVLPSQVNNEGSKVIEAAMKRAGTKVYTRQRVHRLIEIMGHVDGVVLDDGTELPAQMVVITTGSTPNTYEVQEAGTAMIGDRVQVDNLMATSAADVYAGGDMCVVPSATSDEHIPNTTWPDAMLQGVTAAFSMAGQPKPYPRLLTVSSSNFYGLTFVSCGDVANPSDDYERVTKQSRGFHHTFLYRSGVLAGFLMVGNVDNVGVLRRFVMNGSPRSTVQKAIGF